MAKVKFVIGEVTIEMESEEVSRAIEAGEVKLETDQLIKKEEGQVIYSKEEFETYKTNLKKQTYKEGKDAGEEMAFKHETLKEKFGIEVTGKSIDKFAEAYKAKILEEANIEPSKKIKELEDDKTKLQENYATLETEFTTYKGQITERETQTKKDNTIMSFIPDEGLKVDKDITLLALKNKAGISVNFTDDGKTEILQNGNVIKDEKTLQPVDGKVFVSNKLKELGLLKVAEGGSGEGDDTGGQNATGYDKFVGEMKKQDIEEGTQAFNVEMNKRIKDKTLTV